MAAGEQSVVDSGLVTIAPERSIMEVETAQVLFFRRGVELDRCGLSTFAIDHARACRQHWRINLISPQDLKNRDVKIRGT